MRASFGPERTFTESVVNDTIETNARFMQKAGLKETVTRNGGAKCCEWCEKLEGTWEYGKQPADFFRQHENCTCVITFRSEKGRRSWNGSRGKRQQVVFQSVENTQETGAALEQKINQFLDSQRNKIDTGGIRNEKPLTKNQIQKAKKSARKQGFNGQIDYSEFSNTAFIYTEEPNGYYRLVIGTDAYPGKNSKTANGKISVDGCMAHEVVGHYQAWMRGTTNENPELEEAQASLRASKFGIDLTEYDRRLLKEDAMDRLSKTEIDYEEIKESLDIWEKWVWKKY